MYQAITTKFLGATNHRPSRVKATSASGHTVTVSWDHALNTTENHLAAARTLAEKLEWRGCWVMGGLEPGFVFVCLMPGSDLRGNGGFVI